MAAVIPRCTHGNIILGCPEDDCPEQNAYLEVMNGRLREWERRLLPSSPTFPMDSDDETGPQERPV